jgi:serine protease Do
MSACIPYPFTVLLGCAAMALPAQAQLSLEYDFRTTGPKVTAAFEPQRAVIQKSSAVIYDGRKEAIYGTVISADGDILTKASEFAKIKNPSVTIDRARFAEVRLVATDPAWDVAHLKVEASGLTPVVFAPASDLPQGTWVVANGATSRTARRVLAGIISAKPREIPVAGGAALGVTLANPEKGDSDLAIEEVNDKGGAKEAGLRKGDVITEVNGQPVKNREELAAILKDAKPGTVAKITYRRGEDTATAEVRLMARSELVGDQLSRNDMMSGRFSERRSGFPRVIQHDILGAPTIVGGPLLDLDGRCVGMNIARASRSESYAIPVEELKELAARMLAYAAKATPPPAADEPKADGGGKRQPVPAIPPRERMD